MEQEIKSSLEVTKLENATLNPNVVIHEPIPSIFCDGFQGIAFTGNTVRINLAEDKFDALTGQISRHIITRLIMPLEHYNAFVDIVINIRKDNSTTPQDVKKEDDTTK